MLSNIRFQCARVRRAQFIIDWHNYTYSVLRKKYNIDELRVSRASDRRIQNSLNSTNDHSLGIIVFDGTMFGFLESVFTLEDLKTSYKLMFYLHFSSK